MPCHKVCHKVSGDVERAREAMWESAHVSWAIRVHRIDLCLLRLILSFQCIIYVLVKVPLHA